jgi:hypothetical protein
MAARISHPCASKFVCFRVEDWAKKLGDRLWNLGKVCCLNDLESKTGQSVSCMSKIMDGIHEF